MSQYIFGKPYTYKDWYIFPDTTLDNLRLDDCPSSVTGTCEDTETVEDCIQICHNNQPCFAGYFIETPDKKNICVPIRKNLGGSSIGPYYRLRNKNIYPELENMKSYVFTSQDTYKYPPDHANNIFFTDKFILTDIASQKSISAEQNEVLADNPIYIQFLPQKIRRSNISQYNIVRNGDEVIINIPDTAYILRDNTENISWILRLSSLEDLNNTFRVFSTDTNKKIGDFLNYQDTLYFTSQGRPVIYDIILKSSTPSNKSPEMYFKITPKIRVYYCENGDCKSDMLENAETDQEKARYNGIPISRNPSCWSCQSYKSTKKNNYWWIYIVLVVILLLIFVRRWFSAARRLL